MNFKELLERYKNGMASEEEKQLVEQEIEKYEAIEEYISELLDDEFRYVEERSGIGTYDEETDRIKKSVNMRLLKVIITSVFIVLALYIGVFYVLSGIIDYVYYDPTAVTDSKGKDYKIPDFYYDMQAYIGLNMPGYAICSLTFQEQKGFGNYELSYSLRDLFTDKEQRCFVNLSRGRLATALDGIHSTKNLFGIWEGFDKILYPAMETPDEYATTVINNEIQRKNEETLRYLNELNPLSYISMKIIFNEDLTMEEFYNMSTEYPSLDFKWVGVRTVKPGTLWSENQPMHLIGFNPNFNYNDYASTTQSPDPEKYPFFNLSYHELFSAKFNGVSEKELTDAKIKALETHFRSRLKYLRSREEFVAIFDYNAYKTDFYDQSLAYIDEHGVNTYGVLVFGTAEEFLKALNGIPYESLHINEVLPVKPDIYYPLSMY